PIFEAVESLTGLEGGAERFREAGKRVVLLSPQGRQLSQALAGELAGAGQIVVVCGRYEGVDERVSEVLATDEVSIGDYVLSGGEPAAVVLVDAVTRLIPGALGSETSAVNESFSEGMLDFPNYTRPVEFRGRRVPEVLLGGHHAEVARWRRLAALRKTRRNRPDLFGRVELSDKERAALDADDEG
ncbi:MAG TPA: tRNA (guanosine(37)-N1)-methyltransferase TrmD, partial [Pyrinomonadaceae bacterium]